jgi:hypothetical protein
MRVTATPSDPRTHKNSEAYTTPRKIFYQTDSFASKAKRTQRKSFFFKKREMQKQANAGLETGKKSEHSIRLQEAMAGRALEGLTKSETDATKNNQKRASKATSKGSTDENERINKKNKKKRQAKKKPSKSERETACPKKKKKNDQN